MNGGAVQDIILNDRYRGAIDSIKGVTQVCDTIFAVFISFCAFFIISAAILRNVVAGCYAANPKFFDMVHGVKEAAAEKAGNVKYVGPFLKVVLKLVPDFKAISDFSDDNVAPRDYFIKAIPQGFVAVMIGVVIYNGFYRDLVGKAANFGSELITRFITKVDPIAIWDGITNSVGSPNLETDGDDTTKGKLTSAITKKGYSLIVSYYTDVSTKEAKANLGSVIEQWANTIVDSSINSDGKLEDPETPYTYAVQADRVYRVPESYGSVSTPTTSDPENVFRYIFYANAVEDFKIESTLHSGEECYIRFIVEVKKDFTKNKTKGGADGSGGSGAPVGGGGIQISGSAIKDGSILKISVQLPQGYSNLKASSAYASPKRYSLYYDKEENMICVNCGTTAKADALEEAITVDSGILSVTGVSITEDASATAKNVSTISIS